MIEKQAYIDILSNVEAVFNKYDFLKNNLDMVNSIKEAIDDFAFRIIIVGGFSSGKSALLNRLVERELFKEDLGPETALPAEISWAPVESAHAVYANGDTREVEISTATASPPSDAMCLSIHLDHPFFKQRPELILVDFPGYDSNVEAHNKAINVYIKRGSAFILLVPATSGTLGQSDIRFLKEVTQYPQSLACFISKSDLRPAEKCAEIAEYVRNGIRTVYGDDIPVFPISSRTDDSEEFQKQVGDAVDRFNPQELFNISLAPAINEQLFTGIDAIEKYIATASLDVRDMDKKIANAKVRQEDLTKQLENERRTLDRKYRNEIIPGITSRLESALRGNVDMLTEAAMSGEERFADAAQALVRPILAGIPGEIQADLRNMIGNMSIGQSAENPVDDNDSVKHLLLNVVDVVSTVIPGASGKHTGGRVGRAARASQAANVVSGIGTGVIVGSLVNPILGVVVGLAPALIEIFCGARKNRQLQNAKNQVKSQVESQIPVILHRLESQVTPAVLETRDMMFAEIKNKIDENMKTAAAAMEQAREEKRKLKEEHESSIAQMQADVDLLKSMIV